MKVVANNGRGYGSIMVETALTIPIFLLLIFSLVELSRTLYVMSSLNIASQQVASKVAINVKRGASYDISSFGQYADQIRYPGAVVNSNQFSFDATDINGNSTVAGGQADGITSTKVVVTASFPPASNPGLKIPFFDPGNLIGLPIFGQNGLQLSGQATCFLERSRRPTVN